MGSLEVGELLYEYTVKLTGLTEYGVSFGDLMAGTVAPPPEGARFDAPFEGVASGPKVKGKLTGVDYLRVHFPPMGSRSRSRAVRSPACART